MDNGTFAKQDFHPSYTTPKPFPSIHNEYQMHTRRSEKSFPYGQNNSVPTYSNFQPNIIKEPIIQQSACNKLSNIFLSAYFFTAF